MEPRGTLWGLMAELDEHTALLHATRSAWRAGYRHMDAYSPFPVEGLAEALGFRSRWIPRLVLGAGVTGGTLAYLLQWWVHTVDYPVNVGGRPFHSWPSFVPVTFEATILLAALTAVACAIALNGLPQPHHPVFNVEAFVRRASQDGFFLCIESSDPRFDPAGTRAFLASVGAREIHAVER